jgi:predicted small metal-binding protein
MLSVSCRDLTIECDFVGRANNEDELMMQMIHHIVKVHKSNISEIMKPELRVRVKAHAKVIS